MASAFFLVSWHSVFFPHLTWLEKILRPLVIYLALLVLFRF